MQKLSETSKSIRTSVVFHDEMKNRLDDASEFLEISKSQLIRKAINVELDKIERRMEKSGFKKRRRYRG